MYNYYYESERPGKDFYTDIASERRSANTSSAGIEFQKKECIIGVWERVRITSEEGERAIMRPMGIYDTLHTDRLDLMCEEQLYDVREEISKRLSVIFEECGIFPGRILVAGFGNQNLTPDSVGPKTASHVKPTLHISEYDSNMFDALDCSEIAVCSPSVPSKTGIDSSDCVRAICEKLSPDALIAIDSIMTSSEKRLGSCIQISTTGLFPGGIGNLHSPITKASMGSPVISIGVPTVMDCRSLMPDKFKSSPFFISPREIDEITNNAAFVIGGAINQAFGLDL